MLSDVPLLPCLVQNAQKPGITLPKLLKKAKTNRSLRLATIHYWGRQKNANLPEIIQANAELAQAHEQLDPLIANLSDRINRGAAILKRYST